MSQQAKNKPDKEEEVITSQADEKQEGSIDLDNFFDGESSLEDFVADMKAPVEKIEPPAYQIEKEEIDPDLGSDVDPEDEEIAGYLDYNEEHRLTAEIGLINLDKCFAFGCSLISGNDMDIYRRRKSKIKGDDYELEVAAALVKKYQLRMSLEWIFATSLIMGYGPMFTKAVGDRSKNKAEKAQQIQ